MPRPRKPVRVFRSRPLSPAKKRMNPSSIPPLPKNVETLVHAEQAIAHFSPMIYAFISHRLKKSKKGDVSRIFAEINTPLAYRLLKFDPNGGRSLHSFLTLQLGFVWADYWREMVGRKMVDRKLNEHERDIFGQPLDPDPKNREVRNKLKMRSLDRMSESRDDSNSRRNARAMPADPYFVKKNEAFEALNSINATLHRIPPNQRQVLYWRYWEDLSMREVAEKMKISESRVCKLEKIALARLRELLDRESH